ncbi:MAG: phage tail protein [bacterium]|nr:phage tail protein [bacterium]
MDPYLGINCIIAVQGTFPPRNDSPEAESELLGTDPYLGEISWFAGNFAPRGWALCNGQLLQISQNPALFSVLGTTYGGDGRTTFALPDMRGRSPIHMGTGPGLSNRRLGERGGSETTTISVANLPAHTHTISPL